LFCLQKNIGDVFWQKKIVNNLKQIWICEFCMTYCTQQVQCCQQIIIQIIENLKNLQVEKSMHHVKNMYGNLTHIIF
jgi:hypothetical protein